MQAIEAGPLAALISSNLAPEEVELNVILLHGFGAPGTDLVGLEHSLNPGKATRYIYLQAPHTLPGMSGPGAGRAWWHIDMMALQVARMTGQHDELAAQVPDGLAEAREALDAAIEALVKEQSLDLSRTVVGGFSQGAMLSCDWTLRSEAPVCGLIQLSGTVICEADWKSLLPKRAGLAVFQSHSPDDQVLPYSLAERHRGSLDGAGLPVTFVEFRGGHGISPDVLQGLSAFLAAR
jgi:phospholipase/carboxylesterase